MKISARARANAKMPQSGIAELLDVRQKICGLCHGLPPPLCTRKIQGTIFHFILDN
jgi:hypothetical protein